jgi:hypothetical protein
MIDSADASWTRGIIFFGTESTREISPKRLSFKDIQQNLRKEFWDVVRTNCIVSTGRGYRVSFSLEEGFQYVRQLARNDSRECESTHYAGVSTHDVGRCRDLTPERIKFRLRRLCATGYDLGAMVNRSRDQPLYDATIRHFSRWREALSAAGINLDNVTRHNPKNLDRDAKRCSTGLSSGE